jgi:hypothetical protein
MLLSYVQAFGKVLGASVSKDPNAESPKGTNSSSQTLPPWPCHSPSLVLQFKYIYISLSGFSLMSRDCHVR